MGTHADTPEGRADDYVGCAGENRDDPDSWGDPEIIDEPWRGPALITPEPDAAIVTDDGEG